MATTIGIMLLFSLMIVPELASPEVSVPCNIDGTINITGQDLTEVPSPDKATCSKLGPLKLIITRGNIETLFTESFADYPRLVLLNLSFGNLTRIDTGAFKGAYALTDVDLSFNQLAILYGRPFQYLRLEKLRIRRTGLMGIGTKIFAGDDFRNLEELDLSHNQLSYLPRSVFNYMAGLRKLNISHNILESLNTGLLSQMTYLTIVDFSYNSLSHIPSGLFQGLMHLDSVVLSHNQLTAGPVVLSFPAAPNVALINCGLTSLPVLTSDPRYAGEETIHLDMKNNPIDCDCRHVDGSITYDGDWVMKCVDGKNRETLLCLSGASSTTDNLIAVIKGRVGEPRPAPTCADVNPTPPAVDNTKFIVVIIVLISFVVVLGFVIGFVCIKWKPDRRETPANYEMTPNGDVP